MNVGEVLASQPVTWANYAQTNVVQQLTLDFGSLIKAIRSLMGSRFFSLVSIVSFLWPIAKRKSFKSCIGKLTLVAAAYFVWQERNFRLFKHLKRSVQEVVDCIMSSVRLKLLSCRFKESYGCGSVSRLGVTCLESSYGMYFGVGVVP
ncbi:hypothetical protein Tco_0874017 [Tanacetum coccineum]|uniref:Reverse transcriptase zinc-binding domain-containing protein n=1 Tax=Tanacetum coccineum TaxID=301880 RepID=A0ABQ5BKT7_9ASTR